MRSQVTQPASSRAVIGACRPPAACLPRGRQCCCVHPTSEAASSVQLQQLAEAPQPGPLARSTLLRSTAAAAAAALVGWPLLLQPPAQAAIIDVMKDQAGGRTILTTSSGIKYTELSTGQGDIPKSGDLVMLDVVGRLEDGGVFLDTRAAGSPLVVQLGVTNKYMPPGLLEVVEGMHAGGERLAVIPASLGYGSRGANLKLGTRRVPGGAPLYYEVELLRCQTTAVGLACCRDVKYPCVDDATLQQLEQMYNSAAAAAQAAAEAAAAGGGGGSINIGV